VQPLIAVLPPHVIDQIAAGEVIERPASVVKELADNAIDAGARTISIETAAGGRGLIRVTDDGSGMSPEDAVLAFERHATSKLRAVDDLWGLTSMGFRGEALPSIASVARVTLTTRRAGDLAATRIAFEAGRRLSVTEVGAPAGTTLEVADLLFNMPARLKFLKGDSTEASHVTELVARLAMAFPQIHFRLRHNGRTALEVPPDRDGFARARALLGPRLAGRLIPVTGEESGIRITAYLGAPDLAQTTARGVQLFVGRRPVRDRNLLHALTMGYGELIPRGRYPVAIVLLDIPAGAVDVNVHPQKTEVRFADPPAVTGAVRHIVQAGVASAPWRAESGATPVHMIASVAPPALPFDGRDATPLAQRYARDLDARAGQAQLAFAPPPRPAQLAFAQPPPPPRPSASASPSPSPRAWVHQVRQSIADSSASVEAERRELGRLDGAFEQAARAAAADPAWGTRAADPGAASLSASPGSEPGQGPPPASPGSAPGQEAPPLAPEPGPDRSDPAVPGPAGLAPEAAATFAPAPARWGTDPGPAFDEALAAASRAFEAAEAAATGAGYFARLRYLGQLDLTYLVCEGDGELVLVDQHAAHERVELARLVARHTARDVATQKMLFPTTFEATPAQLAVVSRAAPVLAQVGFEAEPFGKATIAIKAVPAGLHQSDPAQVLRRLLDEWAADHAPSDEERVLRALAQIACHSVVRAGDRLASGEVEALLRALDGVDLSAPTPHGRATLLRLPLAEIGRRFGR
jgi:DNA mismatch repair protein MutL